MLTTHVDNNQSNYSILTFLIPSSKIYKFVKLYIYSLKFDPISSTAMKLITSNIISELIVRR